MWIHFILINNIAYCCRSINKNNQNFKLIVINKYKKQDFKWEDVVFETAIL